MWFSSIWTAPWSIIEARSWKRSGRSSRPRRTRRLHRRSWWRCGGRWRGGTCGNTWLVSAPSLSNADAGSGPSCPCSASRFLKVPAFWTPGSPSATEESWRSYPDVQPCLETLKRRPRGPRLAVLTNGDPDQQRAKLARFGLLEYFEAVLTPTELGAAKPDSAAFATACRRMRTDPAQAVNVGDMLEGDANAATLAGLTGIWLDRGIDFITGGPPPTADETVLRIERLTDLPDQLSRTNA
ncbi:HAD family hydrolase [Acrocarpospora pleiomorpha]|nr:HAD family hydrolase [Acrocarpospora pleiomorpha]